MGNSPPESPVAIITGGLQGLGLGIAQQMLKDGFNIAIIDIQEDAELPEEMLGSGENKGRCHYYHMDISDLTRHSEVLNKILADFGRMDCLVNNAGIASRPLTDILDLNPDAFDQSVNINLRGTFFLTQAFAKKLLETGQEATNSYRSIIIITSILAELVSTDRSPYCITKSALSTTTKLFAARLASAGVHVHEIRPGLMQTEMTSTVGKDTIEEMISGGFVPIPRWGQPEDIGKTVSSLASGQLPYMTGQPIWVAGGINIAPIL